MPTPTTNGATKRLHWSALPALSHKRSSPEPSGLKFTAVRTRVHSRLDSSSEPQVLGGLLAVGCWLLAVGYWLLAVGSQLIVFVAHGLNRLNRLTHARCLCCWRLCRVLTSRRMRGRSDSPSVLSVRSVGDYRTVLIL